MALDRESMRQSIKVLTVRGREVRVYFNPRSDMFEATLDDQEFEASSLEALHQKMVKTSEPVRVEVKVTSLERGEVKHGTVIGIHGSNGNLLVRWDGKTVAEQISSYASANIALRLSPEQVVEYRSLEAAVDAARKRVETFRGREVLSNLELKRVVKAEIDKKVAGKVGKPGADKAGS